MPRAPIRCAIGRAQTAHCQRGLGFGERQAIAATTGERPDAFQRILQSTSLLDPLSQGYRESQANFLDDFFRESERFQDVGSGGRTVISWIAESPGERREIAGPI